MCAEDRKEESCGAGGFAKMFEKMKGCCAGEGDSSSSCFEKMKGMMEACCGAGSGKKTGESCDS